jgi:hypothetical protein
MPAFTGSDRTHRMNDPIPPQTLEYEGSQITLDSTGLTITGRTIRINSGEPPAGSNVLRVGDMQIGLGVQGIYITAPKIVLSHDQTTN